MSKGSKLLIPILIALCLSINGMLVYVLFNIYKDDSISSMSEDEILDHGKTLISQHFSYLNTNEYDKAYENFNKMYKDSVSLDEYISYQDLRSKVDSNYEILAISLNKEKTTDTEYAFDSKIKYIDSVLKESVETNMPITLIMEDRQFRISSDKKTYNQNMAYYYASLSLSNFDERKYYECLENIEKGLKYVPDHQGLYYTKGQAEYLLGKFPESIESMKKIYANLEDPLSKGIAGGVIAGSYASMGQFKDGKPYIDEAIKLNPDGPFFKELKNIIDDNLNKSSNTYSSTNGLITITYSDGTTYSGQYNNGMPNGVGTSIVPTGEKQYGEYKNGQLHGKGVFSIPGSGVYIGNFSGGLQHGEGYYYFGNRYYKTIHNYGKLINSRQLQSRIEYNDPPFYLSRDWDSYAKKFNTWSYSYDSPAAGTFNLPPGTKVYKYVPDGVKKVYNYNYY